MAEAKAKVRKVLSVSLASPASFNGSQVHYFAAGKYGIERDERGDVWVTEARGRSLFIPKQLAILEFAGE